MRVLHISHSAQPGGANRVLMSILRHAPADAESAVVFLERGPALEEAEALGVPAAVVETGSARQAWRLPGVVRRLRGAARELDAGLVFAHVSKAQPYAWLAARLEGVPSVWWQHEHLGLKPALQQAAGRTPAWTVVCSSEWTAAEQQARFPRTPVEVVNPGIEAAASFREHEHVAGSGQEVIVGVVGRLQRWKRVELALRAWPAVLEEEPGARLRVIGGATEGLDEDYPGELRRDADRLGLARAVEFTGQLPAAEDLIGGLDLLVHPAEREPFGMVMVEALQHGVPVVAGNEGGPREIVRSGVDGLLVEVTDTAALAAAVIELVRDPARRARMGAEGRRRALERFTAERMASATWALIRRATP